MWEDAYKVSFADVGSSVDLLIEVYSTFIMYKIVDSHELQKVTIFIITITNKTDRIEETKKYQWKTSHKENFKK